MDRIIRFIRALLTLAVALPVIGVGCAGDKSNPMGTDTGSGAKNAPTPLAKPAMLASNPAGSGEMRTLIPTGSLLTQDAAQASANQSNQQHTGGQDDATADAEADNGEDAEDGEGDTEDGEGPEDGEGDAEDGNIEQEIAVADLPPAIRAAALANGGTLLAAESEREGGQLVYEVEVEVGGAVLEMEIAADGTILETESAGEDAEEDDGEDGDGQNSDMAADNAPAQTTNAFFTRFTPSANTQTTTAFLARFTPRASAPKIRAVTLAEAQGTDSSTATQDADGAEGAENGDGEDEDADGEGENGDAEDADENEETVAPGDLTIVVAEAVLAALPGADILTAERGREDGQLVYEVTAMADGIVYEIELDANGTVLEIEEDD